MIDVLGPEADVPAAVEARWEAFRQAKRPHAPLGYSEPELADARRALFASGSEFLATRREDVIGIDNVLAEVDPVIHWLRHPEAYERYGSRLEPGLLLEGDPGTGKTLTARYIASASAAHFINVRDWPHTGSLFTDRDIAELFRHARQHYAGTHQPVVLFWDEFENGACERESATPEQVATVSQLTAELDGVHGKNAGVLLIGCTNYIYGIDQALRRSGRMGVHIEFRAPDRAGKRLILDHYLVKYSLRNDIDAENLSYFFDESATAADIEEACVEAWRYAVNRHLRACEGAEVITGVPFLEQRDLIRVFVKRLVGPPSSFINLAPEDRLRVAVHEVGHALAALIVGVPLRLITVQAGKQALGRTMIAEMEEHISTIEEMHKHMVIGLGSIAAEHICGISVMAGCTGDIKTVNELATQTIDRMGALERFFNPTAVAGARGGAQGPNPNVSELSIHNSDQAIKEKIEWAYEEAYTHLAEMGKEAILDIARALNTSVTMTGGPFQELVEQTAPIPLWAWPHI